jgi:hypothetical protein
MQKELEKAYTVGRTASAERDVLASDMKRIGNAARVSGLVSGFTPWPASNTTTAPSGTMSGGNQELLGKKTSARVKTTSTNL